MCGPAGDNHQLQQHEQPHADSQHERRRDAAPRDPEGEAAAGDIADNEPDGRDQQHPGDLIGVVTGDIAQPRPGPQRLDRQERALRGRGHRRDDPEVATDENLPDAGQHDAQGTGGFAARPVWGNEPEQKCGA